jgi:hypothetical protein
MEKQQTLRGTASGAVPPCPAGGAPKSMAAQPRDGAPHRIVDLRNQITAGGSSPATTPPSGKTPAEPPRPSGSKR